MSLTARSPTLLVDILENQLPESSDTKKQHAISQPIPPPLRPGRIPQVDEAVSELAFARSSCQEKSPGLTGRATSKAPGTVRSPALTNDYEVHV
jgi:hypothetical protein